MVRARERKRLADRPAFRERRRDALDGVARAAEHYLVRAVVHRDVRVPAGGRDELPQHADVDAAGRQEEPFGNARLALELLVDAVHAEHVRRQLGVIRDTHDARGQQGGMLSRAVSDHRIGADPERRAANFEVVERDGSHVVRLDVLRECEARVEVYHLAETLTSETIVHKHIPAGTFEATIPIEAVQHDAGVVLVTLDGKESYSARIERT